MVQRKLILHAPFKESNNVTVHSIVNKIDVPFIRLSAPTLTHNIVLYELI